MPEELEDIIARLKREGYSAIDVHKWLRVNKAAVPFVLVRKIYLKS